MPDEIRLQMAFQKIREEMLFLSQEMLALKQEISQIKRQLDSVLYQGTSPTQIQHPAHNPAHNIINYSLNKQNFHSSTGNDGVPADKQTDSQQTVNRQLNTLKRTFEATNELPKKPLETSEITSILGSLKQDLGEKFKKLTKQEFLIFSVLYTLEEELKNVTYRDLAQKTGLTESSIRDYITRLERKGIPIHKEKINNKVILLRIPREFKEITSLSSLDNSLNKARFP